MAEYVIDASVAANTSLTAFHNVGVRIFTHSDMVHRAREISRQFNQERIYDSIYAASF